MFAIELSTIFEKSISLSRVPALFRTDKSLVNESLLIAGEFDHASISRYFSTAVASSDLVEPSNEGRRASATLSLVSVVM